MRLSRWPEVYTVYKRILIPIDGGPGGEQTLLWGLEFAKAVGAEVAFLHVLENPLTRTYSLPGGASYAAELMQDLREAGAAILENAKLRAKDAGVTCDAFMREGEHPARAILHAEAAYHLTIMGTHSRRGLDRLFLGSVTEAVLRRSDKPRLILHCLEGDAPAPFSGPQHFLLPIDGSACADRAVEEGLQLAKVLGARVTFLHALETPVSVYTVPESMVYDPNTYEDLRRLARAALEKAERRATALGVEAAVQLVEGTGVRAEGAILAAEEASDLTVMGTHGRRGLGRALLGSVTEGVLRQSSVPHLVVRCTEG